LAANEERQIYYLFAIQITVREFKDIAGRAT